MSSSELHFCGCQLFGDKLILVVCNGLPHGCSQQGRQPPIVHAGYQTPAPQKTLTWHDLAAPCSEVETKIAPECRCSISLCWYALAMFLSLPTPAVQCQSGRAQVSIEILIQLENKVIALCWLPTRSRYNIKQLSIKNQSRYSNLYFVKQLPLLLVAGCQWSPVSPKGCDFLLLIEKPLRTPWLRHAVSHAVSPKNPMASQASHGTLRHGAIPWSRLLQRLELGLATHPRLNGTTIRSRANMIQIIHWTMDLFICMDLFCDLVCSYFI